MVVARYTLTFLNLARSNALDARNQTQKDGNPMNLQQLLSMKVVAKDKDDNEIEISPEFRVAVQSIMSNGVHIIIHADGHNSDTLDLVVMGNDILKLEKYKEYMDARGKF